MTRPGPPPKQPERRVDRHKDRARLVPLPSRHPEPPAAPSDLLAWTRERWDVYWRSPVVAALDEVDFPAVEAYFRTLDEWRRCGDVDRERTFVPGSKGQPVLNPLLKRADKLVAMLPRLAAEIGASPLARLRLGVVVGHAARTLDDINRLAQEEADRNPSPDPRLLDLATD